MLDKYQLLIQKLKKPSQIKTELKTLYQIEYEETLETILTINENNFIENIFLHIKSLIIDQYSQKAFENFEFNSLFKLINNDFYKNTYLQDKSFLLKWLKQNNKRISNKHQSTKFNFLKHCNYQNDIPLHHCSSLNQFSLIYKDNHIYGAYCKQCKNVYKSKFIKLYCDFCDVIYYSRIEINTLNTNNHLQPVTWATYHCNLILNEQMKCIQCKGLLFINLKTNELICNRCKFTSNPNDIIWKCIKCGEEFNSNTKIYNPYEYKSISIAVKKALYDKQIAAPLILPCGHKGKNIKHKIECQGELYLTYLNERKMVMCNKCKGLMKYDKFIWVCNECNRKFRDIKGNGVLIENDKHLLINSKSSNNLTVELEFGKNNEKYHKHTLKNERMLSAKNILKSTLGMDVIERKNKEVTSTKPSTSSSSLTSNNVWCNNSYVKSKSSVIKENSVEKETQSNSTPFHVSKSVSNITFPHKYKDIIIKNDKITNTNENDNSTQFDMLCSLQQKQFQINNNNFNKIHPTINNNKLLNYYLRANNNIHNYKIKSEIQNIPKFDISKFDTISQISQGITSKVLCVKKRNTFNFYVIKKEFINNNNKDTIYLHIIIQYYLSKQTPYIISISALNETKDEISTLQELGINNLLGEIVFNRKMHKIYDESELIKIIYQITEAMAILNENNYTHFNIQPINIVVFNEENKQYKLCDFDTIKNISLSSKYNISIKELTLTQFISPQRYAFAHLDNDKPITNKDFNLMKSDMYSLGLVIMYMMMPFDNIKILTNDFINLDCESILKEQDYIRNTVIKYLDMPVLNGKKYNKSNGYNKHCYSDIFVDMLCGMLDVRENKRFSFKELKNYILKYYQ